MSSVGPPRPPPSTARSSAPRPRSTARRSHLPAAQPSWEYTALSLAGSVDVDGVPLAPGPLLYLGSGRSDLLLRTDTTARLLLMGGEPFEEHIVMWWNCVGRDHDDIAAAREQWMRADPRFGTVPAIPATACPHRRCPPSDSNHGAGTGDLNRRRVPAPPAAVASEQRSAFVKLSALVDAVPDQARLPKPSGGLTMTPSDAGEAGCRRGRRRRLRTPLGRGHLQPAPVRVRHDHAQDPGHRHGRPAAAPRPHRAHRGHQPPPGRATAGKGDMPLTWINRRSADRGQGDNLSASREMDCPPTGKCWALAYSA